MRRLLLTIMVGVAALSMGGCPGGPVVESEGVFLAPRLWSQFGCDGESSGFNAVHSTLALAPLKAWSAPVGELGSSGPVIGPDGTIFVANLNGEVVALTSNGFERWRRKLDRSIFASPAVDIETGDVFVIGNNLDAAGDLTSRLYRLTSGGGLISVSFEPFVAIGAPKIWKSFLFVVADHEVLVFDSNTLTLLGRSKPDCINLVCGDVPLPASVDLVTCVTTFLTSELAGVTECMGDFSRTFTRPTSVSIVDNETLVDPENPVVILVTDQCATALRFHPSGNGPRPFDPFLEPIWSRALVPINCDFPNTLTTPAAIVLGGQVVFGAGEEVVSLDLATGADLWRRNVGSSLAHPPAAAIRQIYVVTDDGRMVMLDSDGDLLTELKLEGAPGGTALSLDFFYVATQAGMHTIALDPQDGFSFDSSIATPGFVGTPLPALGGGGSIFVSTPDGFVHAYAATGVLHKPVRVPQVNWDGLADGSQLSAAAAPELSAAVIGADGGEFVGTVAFASDIDGLLCEVFAANGRAACTPTHALTPGTHHLSAFALDESGGANLAEITVEVTNSAPIVTIDPQLQLANNLHAAVPIHFQATVTDPEEGELPASQIRWTSSISGEIGQGAAIDAPLAAGLHTITVTATDSFGAIGQATTQIQISGNSPPNVTLVTPSNMAAFVAEDLIQFTVMVDDPDESEVDLSKVIWRSSLDGELGNGLILNLHLSVGTHVISVTATDLVGAVTTKSVTIQVNP